MYTKFNLKQRLKQRQHERTKSLVWYEFLLFYQMKVFVALLFAFFVTFGTASLCEICIKTTEHLQNLLLAIAPEKPAKEVVQAVCERQCKIL